MKKAHLEFTVGLFLAIGIGCLAWLSIELARKEFFASKGYEVRALKLAGWRVSGSPIMKPRYK